MVVRRGEAAGSAFFILDGRVHAGVPGDGGDGGYRALSTMEPGDFFGEIAALTGGPRTADVVTDGATTLLEVPAAGLRDLMRDPALSELILDKLTERLFRTSTSDLPRLAGLDQASLRELRTPQPSVERLPKTYAER
jgi:CRP-like cAMP-binding protein